MRNTVPELIGSPGNGALHVVAAVLRDADGRVLIQKRPTGKVAAGLWEFPGGKVDDGEQRFAALQRELREELGLQALAGQPLIRLVHHYNHAVVDLDVWEVDRFQGEASGLEAQEVRWVPADELHQYEYPAANLPVVTAVCLPDQMMVTGSHEEDARLIAEVAGAVENGCRIVQFRAHEFGDNRYVSMARELLALCHEAGAHLILNRDPDMFERVPADGLHLTEARLRECRRRPVSDSVWFSASVHDGAGLELAASCDADFVSLGPVLPTLSHPGAQHLGWGAFGELLASTHLPVYAQGGMSPADLAPARMCGARGIAGIRLFQHEVQEL